MTQPHRFLLIIIAGAAPAFAQPFPRSSWRNLSATSTRPWPDFDKLQAGLNLQLESLGRFSPDYETGMRLLDERKYDDAVQRFDRVVASKSTRGPKATTESLFAQPPRPP